MRAHDSIPESANVVAEFDSLDDADEALYELRLSGFRDRQIEYLSQTPAGVTSDLLDRYYWLAGAVFGAAAGVALGIWLARVIPAWGTYWNLDQFGLLITCVTFGALFLGSVGALIGLRIPRRASAPSSPELAASPFVMAVSAGEARDEAQAVIHRHGGHDVRATGPAVPAAHPA
jgi:hypothetical protein